MTAQDIVKAYYDAGYRVVYWPTKGDIKGPTEEGWTQREYPIEGYQEGYRVGIFTGTQISPGVYIHDVDIDWAPGITIAINLLPPTGFVYGRASKTPSHAMFGLSEPMPTFRYEDIDRTCLIELRGTKNDGSIGFQSMVPPSIWSKEAAREQLQLLKFEGVAVLAPSALKQRVCLAAIGMIMARHFGVNGFGHESRLAWAGFLLRAGIPIEDLVKMGESMSAYCNNRELVDVRRVVESTAAALGVDHKKVKGGPMLARLLGEKGREVISRVNDWLGRDSDFLRANGRIIPKSQANIRRALELLGYELSYDEFAEKPLLNGRAFKDEEIDNIELQVDHEFHFQPPEMFFRKVFTNIAWNNRFHPVKQYLNGLMWDGTPRIDTWLIASAGVEDSPYTRAISSIVLIAAVRRVRHPGSKYDEMIVWESEQGAYKSSAAQALCPNPHWFSDDLQLNLKSQQLIEATLGKWIMEASDLAGKRKAELEQLKAMLSRQVDGPARMAYAHFPVERPRQFIIIGTTNSKAYLTDPTGARRFWPVEVRPFDITWIKAHRDQLWAEAAQREMEGESIRLHESLWPSAAEKQENRREIDPWEHILYELIQRTEPSSNGKRRLATTSLWETLGVVVERRDRFGGLRIADIMQRLGFVRSRVRPPGGAVVGGYIEEKRVVDEDDLPEGED